MNLFIGSIQGENALITENEAHHLQKVLRKDVGDEILVTDGQGEIYAGKISSINKKLVVVSELNMINNQQKRPYHIEVAIAPTKQIDRTEFFLEKAIEIGLDAMYPIISFHSERRKLNQERLERVGLAAMKQSLKGNMTKIESITKFDELLSHSKEFEGQKFIAHCHPEIYRIPLKEVIQIHHKYLFLIGPEGDFTKDEIEKAVQHGFTSITLGNQRMRTETAALSCVSGVHWFHQ